MFFSFTSFFKSIFDQQLDTNYKEYETISNHQKNVDFPAKLLRAVIEVGATLLGSHYDHLLIFHTSFELRKKIFSLLKTYLSSCSSKEKATNERLVEPLMSVVKSYEGGRESHARIMVQYLFEEYLSVEELFSDNIQVILFNITR